MVVLNFFGKIQRICISEKLKIYLSNLPNEKYNEWRDELADVLYLSAKADRLFQEKLQTKHPSGINHLYKTLYPNSDVPDVLEKEHFISIADSMICITMDYSYDDMPLGGWETNCFDGRLCEEDYTEKIIDLINYLSYQNIENMRIPKPIPQWIYSSNHDEIDHYRIFGCANPCEDYIKSLKSWGAIFDSFLCDRNDFLLFDYLTNSIHKDNEYNEYHLMKAYSLCQLFLEKNHESELDNKLIPFIHIDCSKDKKIKYSQLIRQMRNKIAHGDFVSFEKKIEQFASDFLDGNFHFDYSEYSRKNWTLLAICCSLDDIVRELIWLLFNDRKSLDEL